MNKEIKKRFDAISRIGCIVCRNEMGIYTPALVHHLLGQENGRKMGRKATDDKTIGLCLHHHDGFLGIHRLGKRAWEEKFGTQADMLEQTNDILRTMN